MKNKPLIITAFDERKIERENKRIQALSNVIEAEQTIVIVEGGGSPSTEASRDIQAVALAEPAQSVISENSSRPGPAKTANKKHVPHLMRKRDRSSFGKVPVTGLRGRGGKHLGSMASTLAMAQKSTPKSELKPALSDASGTYRFKNLNIPNWVDNPSAVYVLDQSGLNLLDLSPARQGVELNDAEALAKTGSLSRILS